MTIPVRMTNAPAHRSRPVRRRPWRAATALSPILATSRHDNATSGVHRPNGGHSRGPNQTETPSPTGLTRAKALAALPALWDAYTSAAFLTVRQACSRRSTAAKLKMSRDAPADALRTRKEIARHRRGDDPTPRLCSTLLSVHLIRWKGWSHVVHAVAWRVVGSRRGW